MFCGHCGSGVPEGGNFCVHCGNRVNRDTSAAAVAPAHPPQAPAPSMSAPHPATPHLAGPPPPAPAPVFNQKCLWCQAPVDSSQISCPRCGATLKLEGGPAAKSGWAQLPARKDMAKLQFGNSFCQVEGTYVPVADMKLAAGEGIYFTHHVLLWKDPQVNITTMPLAGAWKRMFAGMPLIMTQAEGPGHIAFSKDDPGELIPLPLQPGQSIDVREHLFLAATHNVVYDWFNTGVWFKTRSGDDTETHYPVGMFMDRFSAPQTPGLLLLHAGGNIFVRELGPGQTILVKPSALIFKDPTVQMHLHLEHPGASFMSWGFWSNRYLWLRLMGPGRIAVQSAFEPIEGESRNMTSCSYATEQRW